VGLLTKRKRMKAKDPDPPAGGAALSNCPNCGQDTSVLDAFCPKCGTLLSEEE
jgi:hypothetical protein